MIQSLMQSAKATPHTLNMIDLERQRFFWSRTEKQGDHLIWTGSAADRDYGFMWIEHKKIYAHRVAYCIAHSLDLIDIADYMILRTCERTDCVEPEHLVKKKKRKPKKN